MHSYVRKVMFYNIILFLKKYKYYFISKSFLIIDNKQPVFMKSMPMRGADNKREDFEYEYY